MSSHGQANEVFVLQGSYTFHLTITHPERICESFDLYTAHNEIVEGQPFVLGVILGQDVLHKGGAEPVAHLRQG